MEHDGPVGRGGRFHGHPEGCWGQGRVRHHLRPAGERGRYCQGTPIGSGKILKLDVLFIGCTQDNLPDKALASAIVTPDRPPPPGAGYLQKTFPSTAAIREEVVGKDCIVS